PELLAQHLRPGVLDREAADVLGALDGDHRPLDAVDERRDRARLDAGPGDAPDEERSKGRGWADVHVYDGFCPIGLGSVNPAFEKDRMSYLRSRTAARRREIVK